MKQKKAVAMCVAVVLCACSCNTNTKKEAKKEEAYRAQYEEACNTPYGKYPKTITYTLGNMTGANNSNMPCGDTYEDNAYTRYLREVLNVQNKDAFEVSDTEGYDDVVDMAIATKNLPDIMVVSDIKTLDLLVKRNLIEDLSDVYETCTSNTIKKMYESYGDSVFNTVTYDGKLMALPGTNIDDGPNLLWIRKDWMDKLGLKDPSTLKEACAIIREFVTKDPGGNGSGQTVGLVCDSNLSGECGYSSQYQTDVIFASRDAYPKQWIYDETGNVVYGSVQKEAKEALSYLHSLYEQNILDPQFLLRSTANLIELIEEGKCGSFFGPWWTPNNPLMQEVAKDEDAKWQSYVISTDDSGVISYHTQNPCDKYVVVRKGYEHPEIAAKMISVLFDSMRYQHNNAKEMVAYYQQNVDPSARPIAINIDYRDALRRCYTSITDVLEGEKEEAQLELLEASYYEACKSYLESKEKGERASPEDWAAYTSRITACRQLDTSDTNKVQSLFFGSTKTMRSEWWQLESLEKKAYLQIVTGEKPINYFDEFVKEWYAEGGEKITKEVSEIVKNQ